MTRWLFRVGCGTSSCQGKGKASSEPGGLQGCAQPEAPGELAEREGFEPTVVFSYSRFPGVRLKPLSHLSAVGEREWERNGRARKPNLRHNKPEMHRKRVHVAIDSLAR